MNNKKTGYVYILTCPSFHEDWVKIGKSSRLEDVRSKESDKELDNTAVACTRFLFPCAYEQKK
jgi:hypothetical protein